jgi:rieske iron-sulfur protein
MALCYTAPQVDMAVLQNAHEVFLCSCDQMKRDGLLRRAISIASRIDGRRRNVSVGDMSESDRCTTSARSIRAELEAPMASCSDPTRRTLILTALVTGAGMVASRSTAAVEDQAGGDQRPQKADVLVLAEGEHAGKIIEAQDLKLGGPPVRAWPKDPKTSVIRNGSRLNEVLLIRLDPAELDEETRSRSADGIVAYSAICVHTGCPITAWVKGATGDKDVFKCVCHNSEFDPRQNARVVFGPAQRRLAALPLAMADGSLTVAAAFLGKVGAQQAR